MLSTHLYFLWLQGVNWLIQTCCARRQVARYCISMARFHSILDHHCVQCNSQTTHASSAFVGHLGNNMVHQTNLQMFAYPSNLWEPFGSKYTWNVVWENFNWVIAIYVHINSIGPSIWPLTPPMIHINIVMTSPPLDNNCIFNNLIIDHVNCTTIVTNKYTMGFIHIFHVMKPLLRTPKWIVVSIFICNSLPTQ